MPTFTSTRQIFRLEGVSVAQLEGARIPAGTQLTAATLVAIDQINPNQSAPFQQNDARLLSSRTFSDFQGQPTSFGPAEAATFLIDGVEVAQQVPDLSFVQFQGGELRLNVQTNDITLSAPIFFEIEGVVYLVPQEPASALGGVTELSSAITLARPALNAGIGVDTSTFVPFEGGEQPMPDPQPDPDPQPMPDPAPEPQPMNIIDGNGRNNRLNGTDDADQINGNGGNDRIDGRDGNDDLIGGRRRDVLNGGNGDDALSGDAGREVLRGGRGEDTLDGGTGNDVLIGGGGADTFVFETGDCRDVIRGFGGNDVVDLSGVAALSDFADVQSALTQVRAGARLDLGEGGSVTFAGLAVDTLTVDDFLF